MTLMTWTRSIAAGGDDDDDDENDLGSGERAVIGQPPQPQNNNNNATVSTSSFTTTRTALSDDDDERIIDVDDEESLVSMSLPPVLNNDDEERQQQQPQQAKEEINCVQICCCGGGGTYYPPPRSSQRRLFLEKMWSLVVVFFILVVITAAVFLVTSSKDNNDDYGNNNNTAIDEWNQSPSPSPPRTEAPTLEGIAELMWNDHHDPTTWSERPLVQYTNCTAQVSQWNIAAAAANKGDDGSTTTDQVLLWYAHNVALNARGTVLAMNSLVQQRVHHQDPWQTMYSMVQVLEYNDDENKNNNDDDLESNRTTYWKQRGQDLLVPLGGSVLALSGDGNTLVVSSYVPKSNKKQAANQVGQIRTYIYDDDDDDNHHQWKPLVGQPLVMPDANYGQDVALNYDGTRLVVGQWTEQQVWVYDRSKSTSIGTSTSTAAGSWNPIAPSPIHYNTHAFGQQVDMSASGNRIVVLDAHQQVFTYDLRVHNDNDSMTTSSSSGSDDKPEFDKLSWIPVAPATEPFQLGTPFSWYPNNNNQNNNHNNNNIHATDFTREGTMTLAAHGNHLAVGVSHLVETNYRRRLKGLVRVWSWDSTASQWSRMGQDLTGPAGFGHDVHLSANGAMLTVYERRDDDDTEDSTSIISYDWEAPTKTWVEDDSTSPVVFQSSRSPHQGTPDRIDVSVDGRVVVYTESSSDDECREPRILAC
mmetsp:Transcript_10551/g.29125  ORF Transcript_10551/g.29125 Transcript_10551/m.29125 type:complete len:699 (-) Transcript_10551:318-2414(-)|eukprot:CAMPEP_0168737676 /NCGR_PEP_ID=MMETSP0724-20121128/10520_1 /TAXON_ID=265536 /ORGANISM="Amphiprora sp., Strain CCMP467" /LENGTH=698 /DNA_ID=CAMNT_0008784955 /DNA_START=31 /DNA_END=2127 /DNA_ORIENTATION=-